MNQEELVEMVLASKQLHDDLLTEYRINQSSDIQYWVVESIALIVWKCEENNPSGMSGPSCPICGWELEVQVMAVGNTIWWLFDHYAREKAIDPFDLINTVDNDELITEILNGSQLQEELAQAKRVVEGERARDLEYRHGELEAKVFQNNERWWAKHGREIPQG